MGKSIYVSYSGLKCFMLRLLITLSLVYCPLNAFFFLFRIFHASQFKSTPLLSPPHHILETGSPWFDLLPCLLLWVCPCIPPYWSSSGSLYSSLKTRNGSTLSSQCWLWENKNLCFSGYLSIKNIFLECNKKCKEFSVIWWSFLREING